MDKQKNSVLHQSDLDYVISRYRSRIADHGPTVESMKSGSEEKQDIRCLVHSSSFLTENPSVLDIGCGVGYYYGYLKKNGIACKYTGYDIVPEYIDKNLESYPEASFEVRNVFEAGINGVFDNVVLSQVLNNRYQSSNNVDVMTKMIELCFAHSRIGVSIDMMSSYVDFKNEDLFYYAPEQMFSIAKTIARRVSLRHDYRGFEFCLQLFHDDAPGFVL